MNDREFGNKIKQDLNYSLGRLDARVTERLKQARERALDAFVAQEVSASPYAFAGHHGHTQHPMIAPRKWLPLAMLMLALAGVMYWQQEMNHDEDVDAALLASDIPLNVYTDHDFHSWLDSSTQR
ncbi:MAG: DUF3619 family protein [Hydrogenophilales bacterium]|nr:DUF3619 family protein [Hydrogenophilales bacterium]